MKDRETGKELVSTFRGPLSIFIIFLVLQMLLGNFALISDKDLLFLRNIFFGEINSF